MADLLSSGLSFLADQLQAHAATSVTYRRGSQQVSLPATIGQTEFRTETEFGVIVIRSRDYLIKRTLLVLGGLPTLPQRGDQIDETIGGVTYAHDLLDLDGEPSWRYSDPFGHLLRIHTKQGATA